MDKAAAASTGQAAICRIQPGSNPSATSPLISGAPTTGAQPIPRAGVTASSVTEPAGSDPAVAGSAGRCEADDVHFAVLTRLWLVLGLLTVAGYGIAALSYRLWIACKGSTA